ncbi:MAG: hypothetical protein ACLFUS_10240 [Candidatus Sumerlaeia bacterium]
MQVSYEELELLMSYEAAQATRYRRYASVAVYRTNGPAPDDRIWEAVGRGSDHWARLGEDGCVVLMVEAPPNRARQAVMRFQDFYRSHTDGQGDVNVAVASYPLDKIDEKGFALHLYDQLKDKPRVKRALSGSVA